MKLYTINNDGINGTTGTVFSHVAVATADLPAERSVDMIETELPKNVTPCEEFGHGYVFTAKVRGGQWNDLMDVPVVPIAVLNNAVVRWVLQWDQGRNPNDLCVTKCSPRQCV